MPLKKNYQYQSCTRKNKPGRYEVTQKHFDIFIDECKYWIKFFGLIGWEVNYALVRSLECRAWCGIHNLSDRIVQIGLSSVWDISPQNKVLRRAAFHEVIELLTMKFYILAIQRESKVSDVEEENHNLVRILENSVFEQDYTKRFHRRKTK